MSLKVVCFLRGIFFIFYKKLQFISLATLLTELLCNILERYCGKKAVSTPKSLHIEIKATKFGLTLVVKSQENVLAGKAIETIQVF